MDDTLQLCQNPAPPTPARSAPGQSQAFSGARVSEPDKVLVRVSRLEGTRHGPGTRGAHSPAEAVEVDLIPFNSVNCHRRVGASSRSWGAPGKGMSCPGVQEVFSTASDMGSTLNSEWQQELVNGTKQGMAFQNHV